MGSDQWEENKQKNESQWIRESLSKTGVGDQPFRIELAERLIELDGKKSVEFFSEMQKAEPSNAFIRRFIETASSIKTDK